MFCAAAASSSGGTRLQDELIITLNKALAQNSAGYKRIGVVGNLALLQQSAADYELLSGDEEAAGERHDQKCRNRLDGQSRGCCMVFDTTGHHSLLGRHVPERLEQGAYQRDCKLWLTACHRTAELRPCNSL